MIILRPVIMFLAMYFSALALNKAELTEVADYYVSQWPGLGKIALLVILQPLHAFDERVPPVHECDHEHVHFKVPGSVVVNGRLVAESQVQVIVNLVPESESEAEVVELLP